MTQAVRKTLDTGIVNGSLPSEIEENTAQMIIDMFPAIERVRFMKTGNEACQAAIRIARAHTDDVDVYSNGYHGHGDIFTSLTFPAHGVKDQFHISYQYDGQNIAIVEASDTPDPEELRKEFKTLIYDEVITGCRVPGNSMHNAQQIKPDLVVLAKAIANGYPLAVVGGSKEQMDKDYYISSTYAAENIALTACNATLEEIKKRDVNDVYFYGKRFFDNMAEILGSMVEIENKGTWAQIQADESFYTKAAQAGLLMAPRVFYHFGHLESRIEDYVFSILKDIKQVG